MLIHTFFNWKLWLLGLLIAFAVVLVAPMFHQAFVSGWISDQDGLQYHPCNDSGHSYLRFLLKQDGDCAIINAVSSDQVDRTAVERFRAWLRGEPEAEQPGRPTVTPGAISWQDFVDGVLRDLEKTTGP